MKKTMLRIGAAALCTTLLIGGVGAVVYADESGEMPTAGTPAATAAAAANKNSTGVKEETVYVLANADGSVNKIIVSDWLKNTQESEKLTDKTELKGIVNVKGDETYTLSGNACVWDAGGKDIYYQGSIEKELPVSVKVSYTLDGASVSPAQLAGKSGHLVMRFEYTNHLTAKTTVGDREETLYVPFAMLTGVLLDNDVFTAVDVTNGKIINDGDRTAVIGFAFPGLQSNLEIDKEKLEIPDYVEISADVKDFKMGNTVTVATSGLFDSQTAEDADEKAKDELSKLTDSMDQLGDAMGQLTDGSSKLYDGLCTLLEKSEELVDGIDKLADGAKKLKEGADELDDGAGEIYAGTKELSLGLDTLVSHNSELNDGARKVFDTLLATAQSELEKAGLTVEILTVENYAEVLEKTMDSLNEESLRAMATAEAKKKVTAAVEANREKVVEGVTEAVKKQVTAQVEANREAIRTAVMQKAGVTEEMYAGSAQVKAQIDAAVDEQIGTMVDEQMVSPAVQTLIEQETDKQMEVLIKENMASEEVQRQIEAAVASGTAGKASIKALKGQLDEYNEFYVGLKDYTKGVTDASIGCDRLLLGTKSLKSGSAQLYLGTCDLYDGILTMKDGTPALLSGVKELRDGAMKLSDGLKELDEKGIGKITELMSGDTAERLKATVELAKEYRSFSGISDGMDGNVKFIYRTESVK